MSRLEDQLNEFQAGYKLDKYLEECHQTDEQYEAHDLNQTVFDYIMYDIKQIQDFVNIAIFRDELPTPTALGMALTKHEDFVVALYRLLETCSVRDKLSFLPKDPDGHHQYKAESCGSFRE